MKTSKLTGAKLLDLATKMRDTAQEISENSTGELVDISVGLTVLSLRVWAIVGLEEVAEESKSWLDDSTYNELVASIEKVKLKSLELSKS